MMEVVILIVIIGLIAIFTIKQHNSNKFFQNEVKKNNGLFRQYINEFGLENLDIILSKDQLDLEYGIIGNASTKKKINPYLMTSLGSNLDGKNFDFIVGKLAKKYESSIHKHERSVVFLYILNGSIDVLLYPNCDHCKIENFQCEGKNALRVTLKKKDYYLIQNETCHKLVSKNGSDIIALFVPSLIKEKQNSMK